MIKTSTEQEYAGRGVAIGMTVTTAVYDGAGQVVAAPATCIGFLGDEPEWLILGSPFKATTLEFVADMEQLDLGKWAWTPRR